jgi:hypothetical protein
MTEKKKGFFGKLINQLDEKLEKKSREKERSGCESSESDSCCR